jgi:DNA helicase-2/ATP-dependent DNA helicase PcrA
MQLQCLEGLNPKQKEAVQTIHENVMVFAGPGTGKTKTLTHKVQYLVEAGVVKPCRKVLAITFTNKAAGEMYERIREKNISRGRVYIATFHKFCANVLRSYADYIGLERDFSIISDKNAQSLAAQLIDKYDLPFKKPKDFLNRVSQLKNSSEHYDAFIEKLPSVVLNMEPAVLEYERTLRNGHFMDFDDLILYTLTLFHERPAVLYAYQHAFPFILIDEMQDTNFGQLALIKKLGEHAEHVMAVADDDQMIYRWRGAVPTVIRDFTSFFQAKTIVLGDNYRSPEIILKVANEIITPVDGRVKKKLNGRPTQPEDCAEIHLFSTHRDEAYWVAGMVNQLLASGVPHHQIAILYRSFQPSFRIFKETFESMHIPFAFLQKGLDEENSSLADLIVETANLVLHPDNTVSLFRILHEIGVRYDLGGNLGEDYCRRLGVSEEQLLKALSKMEPEDELDRRIVRLARYITQYDGRNGFRSLFDELYDVLHIDGVLLDMKDEIHEKEKENLVRLRTRWQASHARDLSELLTELQLETATDLISNDVSLIRGLTIHASKGLEFEAVFLIGMEKFIIPGLNTSTTGMADERRNLYVGVTRSKSKLYMSISLQRPTPSGYMKDQEPCPFLYDIKSARLIDHTK